MLEHEDGINAFAAGNSPADAAIAVTRGAATRLKRDELQGVIAHEFSHILNGDMRLNVRLLGWTFGLLAVAIVARVVLQSSPRRRRPEPQGWSGRAHARGAGGDGAGLHRRVLRASAAGGGVAASRAARRCVGRAVHAQSRSGLSGALLKIAGASSRLAAGLAGSRRSGAHVVRRGPAAFVCHASAASKSGSRRSIRRSAPANCRRSRREAARDSERQRAEDAARRAPRSQPDGATTSAFARAADAEHPRSRAARHRGAGGHYRQ